MHRTTARHAARAQTRAQPRSNYCWLFIVTLVAPSWPRFGPCALRSFPCSVLQLHHSSIWKEGPRDFSFQNLLLAALSPECDVKDGRRLHWGSISRYQFHQPQHLPTILTAPLSYRRQKARHLHHGPCACDPGTPGGVNLCRAGSAGLQLLILQVFPGKT